MSWLAKYWDAKYWDANCWLAAYWLAEYWLAEYWLVVSCQSAQILLYHFYRQDSGHCVETIDQYRIDETNVRMLEEADRDLLGV